MENFANLISKEPSKFLEKFEEYKANRKKLDRSAIIALNVLQILKEKNWTQKDLALKMGVSPQQVNKIVKGNENFTFETIDKLECVLELNLMDIPVYKSVNNIKTTAEGVKAVQEKWTEEFILNKADKTFNDCTEKITHKMTVVYNVNYETPLKEYKTSVAV